jgi:hypothetical protein
LPADDARQYVAAKSSWFKIDRVPGPPQTIAPDPGAWIEGYALLEAGSLSTKKTLIKDPHPNKHISTDSVTLCLERIFCDDYH